LPYGRSAPVYLLRGTKQGDLLSPLLFNLIFNALLTGLRQSGVGVRTVTGLRANSKGYADDLAMCTSTSSGMHKLLQVVSSFCDWSGMRVKLQKSVISAYDYKAHEDLPTEGIRYNGGALVRLPAHESFRYLGVRAALAGRKRLTRARPGGTSRGAAATAAQGSRREAHLPVRLIWQFLVRIFASFADRQVRQWASLEAEGPPEPIGQSRAATRPRPAELCQSEMGSRKGLGYPSEPDPSDSEVNAADLTTRVD
jgi:hypothetical protein